MLQIGEQRCPLERLVAEGRAIVVVERRLEGCGADVAVEDARVRMVEDRGLHAALQERLRLAHEVLVESVLACDEHRETVAAPAGPSPLLAQGRDGAREADGDGAVEQADVDAQLERVGGRDAEQLAFDQAPLDVAPLRRCVAGAIRSEPLAGGRVDAFDGELVDQLRRLPAFREADRPQPPRDELGHELRRIAERACAQPELRVEQLRVPEQDRSFGTRRSVGVDDGRLDACEPGRELARVGDRRRGEQELRVGSIDLRQAAQTTEHVADVRAEDPAIHMRLVHDDVAQVVQDVGPAVVMREHPDVEHVGVRQHDVRPLTNLPAPFPRGVSVVDRGAHVRRLELRECTSLVLRERFRRVEVKRAVLRVARDRVEHRQVEAEGLPGSRPGGENHVLTARRRVEGVALVHVELVERQSFAKLRLQRLRQRHDAGVCGGHRLDVGDLFALEQFVPERRAHSHLAMVAWGHRGAFRG